jgi:hypothetical protein
LELTQSIPQQWIKGVKPKPCALQAKAEDPSMLVTQKIDGNTLDFAPLRHTGLCHGVRHQQRQAWAFSSPYPTQLWAGPMMLASPGSLLRWNRTAAKTRQVCHFDLIEPRPKTPRQGPFSSSIVKLRPGRRSCIISMFLASASLNHDVISPSNGPNIPFFQHDLDWLGGIGASTSGGPHLSEFVPFGMDRHGLGPP